MRLTLPYSIGNIGGGQVLEGAHLLRLDGIEEVRCIKVGSGPSGAFVEAIARGLARSLGTRPESLRSPDLKHVTLGLVDSELRLMAKLVRLRALARHSQDRKTVQALERKLRMRVAARLLRRLNPEFVDAALKLIHAEALRHGADVWV
jgi:hypothetical protein